MADPEARREAVTTALANIGTLGSLVVSLGIVRI